MSLANHSVEHQTTLISESLRRDLALVFADVDAQLRGQQAAGGDQAQWAAMVETAAQQWARQLKGADAPAIVNVHRLSIEAVRGALAVAEAAGAKLLLTDRPGSKLSKPVRVMMTASLGELMECELVIWVGCHGASDAWCERLAQAQLRGAFLAGDLATVLRLRSLLREQPKAEPVGEFGRISVVLGHDTDPLVAAQWHQLAGEQQRAHRIMVFQLANLARVYNWRGALECVAWSTGIWAAHGGVDFAAGVPVVCDDLASLQARGGVDVVLDVATLAGELASLRVPSRAQVMRHDGAVLWLCDDPQSAEQDPAVKFFARLCELLEAQEVVR